MKTIKIEWLYDEIECETCGWSYAEGAVVHIDGEQILCEEAVAHCFGGNTITTQEVYEKILNHLGYKVETVDEDCSE